jgi:L-arabinose isomerase
MEDYTYDLTPGRERILGAHMLEVCPSIAAGIPTLEIHPLSIGGREDPVRLRFTAAPAEAVIVGINDMGSRFRLVANAVRVVEPTAELPNLPVACAVWEPLPSWSTSAEAWLMAGAPHHTVMSTAVGTEIIDDFAEMTGTELLLIDETTTVRGFQHELRWNDVYHHVAAGL